MARKNRTANPAYIEGMRMIRRGNAAQPHDNRPKRERSRNAARRAATQRDGW